MLSRLGQSKCLVQVHVVPSTAIATLDSPKRRVMPERPRRIQYNS